MSDTRDRQVGHTPSAYFLVAHTEHGDLLPCPELFLGRDDAIKVKDHWIAKAAVIGVGLTVTVTPLYGLPDERETFTS